MNFLPLLKPTPRSLAKCVLMGSGALLGVVAAANSDSDDVRRLGDLSIEQLMDETVTSVSKREERLGDAATAISVLSRDDLQRSGATTLVDALRLVPGLQVGASNDALWAVSARGFNGIYANKLLVLVDGRATYLPTFAGVSWNLQQVMIEDIERIEIIRGPGATMWGANAVNGVINIVTRSAADTQGGMVYGGTGTLINSMGGAHYGDALNDRTFYRVSGSFQNQNAHLLGNGQDGGNAWYARQGSARVDHYGSNDSHLSWQAGATNSETEDNAFGDKNFNTVVRWEQRRSDRSNLDIQAYFDRTEVVATTLNDRTDIYDLSLHHTFGIGNVNDVIWGAGYRHLHNEWQPSHSIATTILQPNFDAQLLSAFIQDELKLIPNRLSVTTGIKWEHNPFTGSEWQPSIRAALKPNEHSTWWAAISRAVRTPDIVEATKTLEVIYGAGFQGPGGGYYLPIIVGNPALRPEVLRAYEFGHRAQLTPQLNVDAAAFYNHYDNLVALASAQRFVPGIPYGRAEIPWENVLTARTKGIELSATWAPVDNWRLIANYSLLIASITGPESADPQGLKHGSPRHQASLRSAYDFGSRLSVDLQARYVGAITNVPAYTTADAHVTYRVTQQLGVALVGQNLLQHSHAELIPVFPFSASEVPRSAYIKVSWDF